MPWKVILAHRNTLQQALDKWSDEVGPIKILAMQQSVGTKNESDGVTLTIHYQLGSGSVGAGYKRPEDNPENNPPGLRSDMGKEDDEFGEAPECPQCGSEMVIRRRKADNIPFWGCKEFPTCRGIVNIEDDDKKKPKNGNKKAKKGEVDKKQTGLEFGSGDEEKEEDDLDDIPF
jgi:hypothetical protein